MPRAGPATSLRTVFESVMTKEALVLPAGSLAVGEYAIQNTQSICNIDF